MPKKSIVASSSVSHLLLYKSQHQSMYKCLNFVEEFLEFIQNWWCPAILPDTAQAKQRTSRMMQGIEIYNEFRIFGGTAFWVRTRDLWIHNPAL